MKWYHWFWLLAAASASPIPPLAAGIWACLVGHLVYDVVTPVEDRPKLLTASSPKQLMDVVRGKDAKIIDGDSLVTRRETSSMPAAKPNQAPLPAKSPKAEGPSARQPDTVGDSNRDGVAEGSTIRLAPPRPPTETAETKPIVSRDIREIFVADNILIVGPKGSGKTTLIRYATQIREGHHIALDPHNFPGKWACRVVGGGRDFAAIDVTLLKAESSLDRRYKMMDKGERREGEFGPFTLVGDEWRAISKELQGASKQKGAGQRLLTLLAEGRKVAIRFMAAAHNDTAEALGIWGDTAMITCFDYIVYLGGMVQRREGIPFEIKEAAKHQSRPAVVLDTEYGEWYLLEVPQLNFHTSDRRKIDEGDPILTTESTESETSYSLDGHPGGSERDTESVQEGEESAQIDAQTVHSGYSCPHCATELLNVQQQSASKRNGYCLTCKDMTTADRALRRMLLSGIS